MPFIRSNLERAVRLSIDGSDAAAQGPACSDRIRPRSGRRRYANASARTAWQARTARHLYAAGPTLLRARSGWRSAIRVGRMDVQATKKPRFLGGSGLSWTSPEGSSGAPGGIRTPDQWLRKPLLYPAELRAPGPALCQTGANRAMSGSSRQGAWVSRRRRPREPASAADAARSRPATRWPPPASAGRPHATLPSVVLVRGHAHPSQARPVPCSSCFPAPAVPAVPQFPLSPYAPAHLMPAAMRNARRANLRMAGAGVRCYPLRHEQAWV